MREGFHEVVLDGGIDRPQHLVENEAEVRARFNPDERPLIECAWCNAKYRSRNVEAAVTWFNTHACGRTDDAYWIASADEAAEFGRKICDSDEQKHPLLRCADCGNGTRAARTESQAVTWYEEHPCVTSARHAA